VIKAPGFVEPVAGGPVQYVQKAIFNGELLDRTWLTAREVHGGGHLEVLLGQKPSAWGTTTRPPSASQSDAIHPAASAAASAPATMADPRK
jgi:putative alpha-1,2-mannosidase